MWVVKQKANKEYYLSYDSEARRRHHERGYWAYICEQSSEVKDRLVRANAANGIICLNDDEGKVRALILTE